MLAPPQDQTFAVEDFLLALFSGTLSLFETYV
jgi:hypothetical protein